MHTSYTRVNNAYPTKDVAEYFSSCIFRNSEWNTYDQCSILTDAEATNDVMISIQCLDTNLTLPPVLQSMLQKFVDVNIIKIVLYLFQVLLTYVQVSIRRLSLKP